MQSNTEILSEAKREAVAVQPQPLVETERDNRSKKQVLEDIHAMFPHAYPSETPINLKKGQSNE